MTRPFKWLWGGLNLTVPTLLAYFAYWLYVPFGLKAQEHLTDKESEPERSEGVLRIEPERVEDVLKEDFFFFFGAGHFFLALIFVVTVPLFWVFWERFPKDRARELLIPRGRGACLSIIVIVGERFFFDTSFSLLLIPCALLPLFLPRTNLLPFGACVFLSLLAGGSAFAAAMFKMRAEAPFGLQAIFAIFYLSGLVLWLLFFLLPFCTWQKLNFEQRTRPYGYYLCLVHTFLRERTINSVVLLLFASPLPIWGLYRAFFSLENLKESIVTGLSVIGIAQVFLAYVLSLQAAAQMITELIFEFDKLARGSYRRIVRDIASRLSGHCVVAGFSDLGRHTARGIIAHKRKDRNWIEYRLLPALSEEWRLLYEQPHRVGLGRTPLLRHLVIVDRNEEKFMGVFDGPFGARLGLVLIKIDSRPPSGGGVGSKAEWGFALGVVGDIVERRTHEAYRMLHSAAVINTIFSGTGSRKLLHQHVDSRRLNKTVLIEMQDKQMDNLYSLDETFYSPTTLFFPGLLVAKAFAERLFRFCFSAARIRSGSRRKLLLLARRHDFGRVIEYLWALVDRNLNSPRWKPEDIRALLMNHIVVLTDDWNWIASEGAIESMGPGEFETIRRVAEPQNLGDRWNSGTPDGLDLEPGAEKLFRGSVRVSRRGLAQDREEFLRFPAAYSRFGLAHLELFLSKFQVDVVGVFFPSNPRLARDVVFEVSTAVTRSRPNPPREHSGQSDWVDPAIVVTASGRAKRDIRRTMQDYDRTVHEVHRQSFPAGFVDVDNIVWKVIHGKITSLDLVESAG